MLANSINNTT